MSDRMTTAEMREAAKRLRHHAEMGTGTSPSRADAIAGADALDRLADVIDLHRPVPIYEDADRCDCADKESHDVIEADGGMWLCAATPLGYSICERCSENEYDEPTTWPCETVRIARGKTDEKEKEE